MMESAANEISEAAKVIGNEIAEAAEDAATEALKEIARLISDALNALRQVDTGAVGEHVLSQLEVMKETGMPITTECMNTIQGHLRSVLKELNDEDVHKLQRAVGRVAAEGIEGFMILWDELQNIFVSAIEEGRELVQESLPAVSRVSAVATKKAAITAAEIYDSGAVQDIIGEGLEEIEDALAQSRESIQMAFNAIAGVSAGGCVAFCPLLRFEIFRDFWQTVSLFFANLYQDITDAPIVESAKVIFGGISNFIAVDMAQALQSDTAVLVGLVLLASLAVIMYVAYLWFIFSAQYMHNADNEIREGHETKKWSEVAAESRKKVKISTYVLTGCLSVYLPLTRTAVEIILVKPDSFVVQHFSEVDMITMTVLSEGSELSWLKVASYIILATFTLPTPIILARLVTKNKPSGSLENPDLAYDVDGEEVKFDDKLYNRLVNQDPNQLKCPYRSLYKGIEQKWAHYKVYQLVWKTLLVVILAVLSTQDVAQSLVSLALYSIIAGLSYYTTPFIDPMDDIMDASGRTTALITCAGGAGLAISSSPTFDQLVGFVVNAANVVNVVIMGIVFCYGIERIRLYMKNFRGRFTFSDSVLEISAGPAEKIVAGWDLERECKHRIWHIFWENVLLYKCGEDVAIRLLQLKEATAQSGGKNIREHFNGESDSQISQWRMQARRELEGVDVYWNDPTGTRDGVLNSKTCFGKMYIHPYPFHCIVIYDDAKDESFVRHDKFVPFFQLNMSQDIQRKRLVRQKLRALSDWKGQVHFPFSRMETETVADGTKQVRYKDAEGNEQTRTETNYSTVSFQCNYENGIIYVRANTDKVMSAGFNVTMTYNDGTGQATLPNTGQLHHFRNRQAVMGHDHLGLRDDMEESLQLQHIFQVAESGWTTYLPTLLGVHNEYRLRLIKSFDDANCILGNGFWYYVYNNQNLPREALERYLLNFEGNPMLKSLCTEHTAALNFLYKRMDYVRLHPAMQLWYTFWDDFYFQNKDMTVLQSYDSDFNPRSGKSVCYCVMKRDVLEEWLEERKLLGTKPSVLMNLTCSPYLFHDGILSSLYGRLAKLTNSDHVEVRV